MMYQERDNTITLSNYEENQEDLEEDVLMYLDVLRRISLLFIWSQATLEGHPLQISQLPTFFSLPGVLQWRT